MSETKTPVFSIITPTSRRPLLLKRTINSVINQTFRDYEHIIVDDTNDQATADLVNLFKDERIVFIQHKNSKGAAGSYNTGIKISRGSFILFLDDDDEYLPTFLEKMFSRFSRAAQNTGFIWTGISRIQDTATGENLVYSKIWPSKFPTKEKGLIEATSIGNGFGVCVRKECIDSIGLYDESIKTGQDTEFLFRLARNYDFETIPEVLVRIHQHGYSQLTDRENDLTRLELRVRILKRNEDLLNTFPGLYNVHYKVVVRLCYKLKLKQRGRKIMISIIKKNPFHLLNYSDLLFFELKGKDTVSLYNNSRLRKFAYIMRGNKFSVYL